MPKVSTSDESECSPKKRRSRTPTITDATISAVIPAFTTYLSTFMPITFTIVQTARKPSAHTMSSFVVGSAPKSAATKRLPK